MQSLGLTHRALRAMPTWLPAYIARQRRYPKRGQTIDILFCLCDHFEPCHATDRQGAMRRLTLWAEQYPRVTEGIRDADGIPPRHTFFSPLEQYDADMLNCLAHMQRGGYGEVELHLHHDNDTAASLRQTLLDSCLKFSEHGLLARDAHGIIRYGFVHGNWALDNSDPRGVNCGVNNELDVLQETGCYADFTMPAAPHPAQTRTINSLYYAIDTPAPKSHNYGQHARVQPNAAPPPGLLLVQGPLALDWRARKRGWLPGIENGELAGNHPPSPRRMRLWLAQSIHVYGRPEWVFIKLHTHGCDEKRGNTAMLLGNPMRDFHQHLMTHYNDGQKFRLHYVTARELVNILHAAEDGHSGNPGAFRNYRYQLL